MLAFALYNNRFDVENLKFSVKLAIVVKRKHALLIACVMNYVCFSFPLDEIK